MIYTMKVNIHSYMI